MEQFFTLPETVEFFGQTMPAYIVVITLVLLGSTIWFFQQKFEWFMWVWGMQHIPKLMFVYVAYMFVPSWHQYDIVITLGVWIILAELFDPSSAFNHRKSRS